MLERRKTFQFVSIERTKSVFNFFKKMTKEFCPHSTRVGILKILLIKCQILQTDLEQIIIIGYPKTVLAEYIVTNELG